MIPGHYRNSRLGHDIFGGAKGWHLVPPGGHILLPYHLPLAAHILECLSRGTNKGHAGVGQRLGKDGIFREKPVSGMNRLVIAVAVGQMGKRSKPGRLSA